LIKKDIKKFDNHHKQGILSRVYFLSKNPADQTHLSQGGVMSYFLSNRILLLLITPIIFLPSCKRVPYHPQSLNSIKQDQAFTHTHADISVTVKKLIKSETRALFDGRGSRLSNKRKPIYPLLLTIENQSAHTVILDPHHISLKLVDQSVIANRLYAHTARRIIAPLLLGIVGTTASFFAAAYITIIGAIAAMPGIVKAGYATLGLSGFFAFGSPVLSYYQGSYATMVNTAIQADLQQKALHAPLYIKPGTSIATLLFVTRRSYHPSFYINLVDQNTQELIRFDIDLIKGVGSCS
jgi:hypothetical protein